MLTYLLLNIGSIAYPLHASFDKRVRVDKQWRHIFPAILSTAAVFIIWDIIFTHKGVWQFNHDYTLGIDIVNLPLEEWMFFFTIPYACIFIYEVIRYYFGNKRLNYHSGKITVILVVSLLICGIYNFDKLYTLVVSLFTAAVLLVHYYRFGEKHLRLFYIAYLFHLIPFFLVNGILTALPVVIYNESEKISFRLWTIPLEDSIYSMALLLMNITVYEILKEKFQNHKVNEPVNAI
ncbi:lycopene cyclase domain-containing protein [Cytophagaceae bacterium ABcell3]|nr:lycopene cyclase domain-containing protein [Cytophagaceae bacterium ABcell3]